jgi:hypothetical protein
VNVTAVLLWLLLYTTVANVVLGVAVQNAAFVQPELAKVIVTVVAALRLVISPPALVE